MQPNSPDPKQPTEGQVPNVQPTGRMIQPLSSEDDIRKAVETTRAEHPTLSQTQRQTSAPSDVNNFGYANAYDQSPLSAEPINHPAQPSQPQFHAVSPQPSDQTNKSGKVVFIIVALIVVAALALGAYFFLFNTKIAVSDLVQETLQQTTYKRPKQWRATGTDGGTFGDLKGENGKSSSAVSARESQQASPLVGASDAAYDQLRTQLLSQASVSSIQPAFQNSGVACNSDITFKAEPDTKKTETAIGLTIMTGSCTRNDGEFTVKIRTVAGSSDGKIRVIALGARNVEWDKNSEAFQAILDSIGQVK